MDQHARAALKGISIFDTLTEAFEDNDAPAAVANVSDDEATLVLLVPGLGVVGCASVRVT